MREVSMIASAMAAARTLMQQSESETDVSQEFSSTSIFVTPMLDMAFQLLAFFIFTYHPSALEGQFPVNLAQSEGGANEAVKRPDIKSTPDKRTETKPEASVIALANMDGQLIALQVVAVNKPPPIAGPAGGKPLPMDELLSRLSTQLREVKATIPKEDRLLLRGDMRLKWADSMRVLDACRKYKDKSGEYRDLFPKVEMDIFRP
jgi:biopolymer transport protein ExbD